MMPILIEHLIEHLDYEELYVNHVPKKYFSPKITRQLVTNRAIHLQVCSRLAAAVADSSSCGPFLCRRARSGSQLRPRSGPCWCRS
jgi:hypothetical protein